MGIHIASREALLPTLVDLFLSSLGTESMEYYSAQQSTLEYQHVDGKSIPFVDTKQKFILLEEHHAPRGTSHCESANLASLNLNLLAASNHHNGKSKPKGGNKPGYQKKA